MLFTSGSQVTITWFSNAVYPLLSPDNYTVDVWLYRLRVGWNQIKRIDSDLPNSGIATCIIPVIDEDDPLFPVAIQVAISTASQQEMNLVESQVGEDPSAGLWTGPAYMNTSKITRQQCQDWLEESVRQTELDTINDLPPCPCTLRQALAPNSRLTEQNFGFPFQQFFNEDASICFYSSAVM